MEKKLQQLAEALFEQKIDPSFFEKYDFAISIDIGGGNCSAALVDLRKESVSMPRVLKLSDLGETSLWSTIGYDSLPGETGTVFIGQDAQNMQYQYSNYKDVPTDDNLEKKIRPDNYMFNGDLIQLNRVGRELETLTVDYIRELYKGILKHPENCFLQEVPKEKIVIIVGHPSSEEWKSDMEHAHSNLVKMVQTATGISAVLTTSESNSAILYSLQTRDYVLGKNRILIVDLGAYSADITFIDRRMRENRKYSSIALGGKSIDQNLATIILENSGLQNDRIDSSFNLLSMARRIKELYWPLEAAEQEVYVPCIDGKSIEVILTHRDFYEAVTQKSIVVYNPDNRSCSYTDHLGAFLESAKKADGLNIQEVDWILITGGAARMRPAMEKIREKAKELWNVQDNDIWPRVIKNGMIDEAVPFGSLWFYLKAQEVICKVPDVYNRLAEESKKMVSPLSETISRDVTDYLVGHVITPAVKAFCDSENDLSINQLTEKLSTEFAMIEHQQKIKEISAEGVAKVFDQNKAVFQTIITDFLRKLFGMDADEVNQKLQIDVTPPLFDSNGVVAKAIQDALSDLGISDVLLIPFLIPVVLSLLVIDALAKGYRTFFYSQKQQQDYQKEQDQKKIENAKEEMNKPRNKNTRKKIYKKIQNDKTKRELFQEIQKKIVKELNAQCEQDYFGIPDQYLDQLTENIRNAVYTGR